MNSDWQEMFPKRRQELIDLLQMDLNWRMNRVSDGQRRRVQLFLHMLRPFEVLLLDEVLSVLDVVVRNDLLQYLKKECEERNATVIYATHIFDGLMDWPTHLSRF
jgi:CCR4-NOT complex subunit CAF16